MQLKLHMVTIEDLVSEPPVPYLAVLSKSAVSDKNKVCSSTDPQTLFYFQQRSNCSTSNTNSTTPPQWTGVGIAAITGICLASDIIGL